MFYTLHQQPNVESRREPALLIYRSCVANPESLNKPDQYASISSKTVWHNIDNNSSIFVACCSHICLPHGLRDRDRNTSSRCVGVGLSFIRHCTTYSSTIFSFRVRVRKHSAYRGDVHMDDAFDYVASEALLLVCGNADFYPHFCERRYVVVQYFEVVLVLL